MVKVTVESKTKKSMRQDSDMVNLISSVTELSPDEVLDLVYNMAIPDLRRIVAYLLLTHLDEIKQSATKGST